MTTQQVYFVSDGVWIKIGISWWTAQRLRTIRSPNGLPIKLMGTVDGGRQLERKLHDKLSAYRRVGEWFDDRKSVRAVIVDTMIDEWIKFGGREIAYAIRALLVDAQITFEEARDLVAREFPA